MRVCAFTMTEDPKMKLYRILTENQSLLSMLPACSTLERPSWELVTMRMTRRPDWLKSDLIYAYYPGIIIMIL